MLVEAAAQLRPVDDASAALVVELVMRAAAAGDAIALRILAAGEHLNALGVEYADEPDDRTWQAVQVIHDGGTPRARSESGKAAAEDQSPLDSTGVRTA
jgi:hypothetical protein